MRASESKERAMCESKRRVRESEGQRERERNAGPMCPTGQISGVYLYPAGQFWSMRQQHVTGTGNGTPHV